MSMAGGPGRIPALLFLAVVIVAIAALLVGYGVPVGVGALAGLLLGATAGAVGVLWLGRGSGRSVNIAGMSWSSDVAWQSLQAESPNEDMVTRMHELSEVFAVDLGRTRSIQPVLATSEANGLALELLALEACEAGATLTLDVRALPGSMPPPSMAEVAVTDDLGTPYRAAGQGHSGSAGRSRYEVRAIPAIPPAARELSVRIERFVDLYPGAPRPAAGPWSFVVAVNA
jgi:hypothetical protein